MVRIKNESSEWVCAKCNSIISELIYETEEREDDRYLIGTCECCVCKFKERFYESKGIDIGRVEIIEQSKL